MEDLEQQLSSGSSPPEYTYTRQNLNNKSYTRQPPPVLSASSVSEVPNQSLPDFHLAQLWSSTDKLCHLSFRHLTTSESRQLVRTLLARLNG
ncbi:hypothetical protein CTA1_593 [Colletotrichum tanaceti]|uniref:Uncharacterized protein n=1 Tax=Colletotrichum tanaceti TaxID=1306861 RepID=A0A4U6X0W5_9PEZI|nr:hypothetical protein CTA1_593 [Colletotrichum tanaceti]